MSFLKTYFFEMFLPRNKGDNSTSTPTFLGHKFLFTWLSGLLFWAKKMFTDLKKKLCPRNVGVGVELSPLIFWAKTFHKYVFEM